MRSCSDGMCGADDCERCHPGCNDDIECAVCGNYIARHEAKTCLVCGRDVCEDCQTNLICAECLAD